MLVVRTAGIGGGSRAKNQAGEAAGQVAVIGLAEAVDSVAPVVDLDDDLKDILTDLKTIKQFLLVRFEYNFIEPSLMCLL